MGKVDGIDFVRHVQMARVVEGRNERLKKLSFDALIKLGNLCKYNPTFRPIQAKVKDEIRHRVKGLGSKR